MAAPTSDMCWVWVYARGRLGGFGGQRSGEAAGAFRKAESQTWRALFSINYFSD